MDKLTIIKKELKNLNIKFKVEVKEYGYKIILLDETLFDFHLNAISNMGFEYHNKQFILCLISYKH